MTISSLYPASRQVGFYLTLLSVITAYPLCSGGLSGPTGHPARRQATQPQTGRRAASASPTRIHSTQLNISHSHYFAHSSDSSDEDTVPARIRNTTETPFRLASPPRMSGANSEAPSVVLRNGRLVVNLPDMHSHDADDNDVSQLHEGHQDRERETGPASLSWPALISGATQNPLFGDYSLEHDSKRILPREVRTTSNRVGLQHITIYTLLYAQGGLGISSEQASFR